MREEIVCKQRLNIERLKKESFDELTNVIQDESKERKSIGKLYGECNYDILMNPFYAERYCYTPCRFPKRSKYAISKYENKDLKKSSLDLVRVVCDLPYLTDKRARAIEFNALYLALERQV